MSSKILNLKNKNTYQEVKAKLVEMVYNRENNLFQIAFEDIEKKKQVVLAIKGTDWGITPDVPEDIIDQFCKDMIGKEKNLHIETEENSSLRDAKKDDKGIVTQEEINRVTNNVDNFPIDEVMNVLHEEQKDDES